MSTKFTDLQCKEVICVSTGQRLGFVSDVLVEVPQGEVRALVVPCPGKLPGIGSHRDDFIIPWNCVRRIGPDIVLVDVRPDDCRAPRRKGRLGI